MPWYEYFCETCQREVTVPMTISRHEQGGVLCPQCQGSNLRPLVGSFFAQTSRKS